MKSSEQKLKKKNLRTYSINSSGFRQMSVVSPTSRFAYIESLRLHSLSRFAYIKIVSPTQAIQTCTLLKELFSSVSLIGIKNHPSDQMFWPEGPAFDVIICSYCHLENAPAKGPPGNVIDPGFCDVLIQ